MLGARNQKTQPVAAFSISGARDYFVNLENAFTTRS